MIGNVGKIGEKVKFQVPDEEKALHVGGQYYLWLNFVVAQKQFLIKFLLGLLCQEAVE